MTPTGDARLRPMLKLREDEVDRLRREGYVIPAPCGYVLATTQKQETQEKIQAPPWAFEAAGLGVPRVTAPDFIRLALRARKGEGPLSIRGVMAGLERVEDAEQASRAAGLAMNRDRAPVEARARSAGPGGGCQAAFRARARLAHIRARLGEETFDFLFAACVWQKRMRRLEDRHGLRRRNGSNFLAQALEKLAAAYES